MRKTTKPMVVEAANAGFHDSPGWGTRHPRLQILTVKELLDGKRIDMPRVGQVSVTFKKALKAKRKKEQQPRLPTLDDESHAGRHTRASS